jgi:KUP system potassium uptake protein
VMATWQKGREIVTAKRQSTEGSLTDFIENLRRKAASIANVPGTAIFLNRGNQTAPLAMRANVDHNHVRHEHVLIISVETLPVPRLSDEDRIEVDPLGYEDDGIFYVSMRFGYAEIQDLQAALRLLDSDTTEGQLDLENASWFLSKIELRRGEAPTMAAWRKRLFIATSYITADAAEHFGLPRDRTVIMGSHIEV